MCDWYIFFTQNLLLSVFAIGKKCNKRRETKKRTPMQPVAYIENIEIN